MQFCGRHTYAYAGMNLLDDCSLSQLFLQRQRLQELLDSEVAYAPRQNRAWLERGTVLPVQWCSSTPASRDALKTDVRIEFRHYKVDNNGKPVGKPTPWRLCQTLATKGVDDDTEHQVRANAAHFLTVATDADGTHPRTEYLYDLIQKAKGVYCGDQLHFDSHLRVDHVDIVYRAAVVPVCALLANARTEVRAIVYDHSKAHPDDRYTHAHVLLTPFASSLHASKSSETHGPVPLYLKTFTNKDARWERRTFALDVSKLLAQKSCTLPMGQCGPDFSATDDGAVWVVSTPLQQEDRDDKAPCCSGEPTHQDDESMDATGYVSEEDWGFPPTNRRDSRHGSSHANARVLRGRETYEADDQGFPCRSLEGQTLVSDVNLQATACCIELVPMPFENQEPSPLELSAVVRMLARRGAETMAPEWY